MDVVAVCDALDIDYDQYMRLPKWWVELKLLKRVADNKHQESKHKK